MKEWSPKVIIIIVLSITIGLIFNWQYPLVEISTGLVVLFVVIAVILKTTGSWIYNRVKNKSENNKNEKD